MFEDFESTIVICRMAEESCIMRTLLVIVILCLVSRIFAQEPMTQTFTSPDGTFSFEYPFGWSIVKLDTTNPPNQINITKLAGQDNLRMPEGFTITVSPPAKFYTIPLSKAETPKEMIEQSMAWARIAEGLLRNSSVNPITGIDADGMPLSTPTILLPSVAPESAQISEFTVDGRDAAYGIFAVKSSLSMITVVVDVGNDYWVTMTGISVAGDLPTIQQNEAIVLQIAQRLRFTPPPPIDSGNPDLPRVYSGPFGIWQVGTVEFYYPEDWYVLNSLSLNISNRKDLLNGQPVTGQFIAQVTSVPETLAVVDPSEAGNECHVVKTLWTAQSVANAVFTQMISSRLEELTKAGIAITQPETITINNVEMAYYRQFEKDAELLTMFVDLGEGDVMALSAVTLRGEMAQFEDQLFQVASTFLYTPNISETCADSEAQTTSMP
jgi:hypothetical protein